MVPTVSLSTCPPAQSASTRLCGDHTHSHFSTAREIPVPDSSSTNPDPPVSVVPTLSHSLFHCPLHVLILPLLMARLCRVR